MCKVRTNMKAINQEIEPTTFTADPLEKVLDRIAAIISEGMTTLGSIVVSNPETAKALNPLDFGRGTILNDVLNLCQISLSINLAVWETHQQDRNDPIDRRMIAGAHFLTILTPYLVLRAPENVEQLVRSIESGDVLSAIRPTLELAALAAAGGINLYAAYDHTQHKSKPIKAMVEPDNSKKPLSDRRRRISDPGSSRLLIDENGKIVDPTYDKLRERDELARKYLPLLNRLETNVEATTRVIAILEKQGQITPQEKSEMMYTAAVQDSRSGGLFDDMTPQSHNDWIEFTDVKRNHRLATTGKPIDGQSYIGTRHITGSDGREYTEHTSIDATSVFDLGSAFRKRKAALNSAIRAFTHLFGIREEIRLSDPKLAASIEEMMNEVRQSGAVADADPTIKINKQYAKKEADRKAGKRGSR